ncbi:MAG: radical SAM protein [Ruminococcus sp.]|jgi:histone acetyltransferase (RNA polymerase elongator complex component)|nr:radical SAM protein [Ruminococcus sp.]
MSHANISIFIPHAGCPYDCIYCNQRIISGMVKTPTAEDVRAELAAAVTKLKSPANTEIAFFGGSFTCLPEEYMTGLLEVAADFVKRFGLKGIRLSTRPDAITPGILDTLSAYGVTAIELGAQSMNDSVLKANRRGHTAADVVTAVKLIRENFAGELGLQIMTGMYGSTFDKDMETARSVAALSPDTVRIYPTVVIKGTELEKVWADGAGFDGGWRGGVGLDEMVSEVADMISLFEDENIRIIRVGLHASETLEATMTGGYYHPSFGELAENELFYRAIKQKLDTPGDYTVYVHPKNLSKAIGQKRKNIVNFARLGYNITVRPDMTLLRRREIRAEQA